MKNKEPVFVHINATKKFKKNKKGMELLQKLVTTAYYSEDLKNKTNVKE